MEPKMDSKPENQANTGVICALCGRKCSEGENFCAQCGARIAPERHDAEAADIPGDAAAELTNEPEAPAGVRTEPEDKPNTPESAALKPIEGAKAMPSAKPNAARKRTGNTVAPYGANPAQPKPEDPPVVKSIFDAVGDAAPELTRAEPRPKPEAKRARRAQNAKKAYIAPETIDPFDVPPRPPALEPFDPPPRAKPSREDEARRARDDKRYAFLDDHLRSLIAMLMLVLTIGGMSIWAVFTPSGQRVMAHIGIGGAKGLALIGDDAMADGNYSRAAENYLQSLSKASSDITAFKLARAYALSGETKDAARALLLCIDLNAARIEAYQMLEILYPDAAARPENVKRALDKGAALYSE